MPLPLIEFHMLLPAFLLVLFRIAGLMLATPFFSSAALPIRIKVLAAVAMTYCVFPLVVTQTAVPVTLSTAIPGLIGELFVGLFVGFGVALIFLGVELALQLIGHQSGMGLGEVFNPMFESTTNAVGQLYQFLVVIIFLAAGGHRELVRTLLESFETLPLLSFRVTEDIVAILIEMLNVSFQLVIRVGGPAILALLLAFLTLGFVSRTMPQLNILSVGFPLKLGIALLILAVSLMAMEPVLLEALTMAMDGVRAGLNLGPVV